MKRKNIIISVSLVRLGVFVACMALLVCQGNVWADAFSDAMDAEGGKVGTLFGDAEPVASETSKVGEGFNPNLTRTQFADEMKVMHPGGNVLFVRLTPLERDKIYSDFYLKGASYQQIIDKMDNWMKVR